MSDTQELKPCRFCGGEAKQDWAVQRPGDCASWMVQCQTCGTISPSVKDWNTRTTSPEVHTLVPEDAMSNIREFEAKWAVLKNRAIEVNDASLIVNMPNKITERQKKVRALIDAAREISCKLEFYVKPEGMDNEWRALDEAIWNKLLLENISRTLYGVVFHEDAIDSTKATAKETLEAFETSLSDGEV